MQIYQILAPSPYQGEGWGEVLQGFLHSLRYSPLEREHLSFANNTKFLLPLLTKERVGVRFYTVVQHFTLEDGAVMLDPNVREYFPNGESVNQALRTLISLFPKNHESITPKSVE